MSSALMLAATLSAAASAQTITGRAVESETGTPIAEVAITLLNASRDTVGSAETDSEGRFLLRSSNAGQYRLRIERVGYQPVQTDVIDLDVGDRLDIVLELRREPVQLQPIVVRSRSQPTLSEIALQGFTERQSWGQRLGIGQYLDREDLDHRPSGTLLDILRTLPGVRVVQHPTCSGEWVVTTGRNPASLRVTGGRGRPQCVPGEEVPDQCPVKFFINGAPIKMDWSVSVDIAISTSVLAAVEVYRSPSELPPEFGGANARCGVVSVWTRRGG